MPVHLIHRLPASPCIPFMMMRMIKMYPKSKKTDSGPSDDDGDEGGGVDDDEESEEEVEHHHHHPW